MKAGNEREGEGAGEEESEETQFAAKEKKMAVDTLIKTLITRHVDEGKLLGLFMSLFTNSS